MDEHWESDVHGHGIVNTPHSARYPTRSEPRAPGSALCMDHDRSSLGPWSVSILCAPTSYLALALRITCLGKLRLSKPDYPLTAVSDMGSMRARVVGVTYLHYSFGGVSLMRHQD